MRSLFIFLFCVFTFCASGQDAILFSDSVTMYQVTGKDILVFEDDTKEKELKQIINE